MTIKTEELYTALEVLVAVACCLGNSLVIWAVWRSKPRREPTFCFVSSLAVADFLVGAAGLPLSLLVDGRVRTSFHGCLLASCVLMALPYSSVLALFAIAVDRYLRVRIPLRYKILVTERRSWGAAATCWLVSLAFTFIPMFGWSSRSGTANVYTNSSTIVCRFVDVIPPAYLFYFGFLMWILAPLLAMTALYSSVFYIIRQRLRENLAQHKELHDYFKKEQSLARSLALVLVLFAVCWLPLYIMNSITYFRGLAAVPKEAIYVGILLTHAHSAVNPVLYGFRIRRIRAEYLYLLGRCIPYWRETGQAMEQNDTSYPNSTGRSDHIVSAMTGGSI